MKTSAGILVYRFNAILQVFLVHPGGPYFRNKDAGSWTIPKGELGEKEDPLVAGRREFFEETGIEVQGNFMELQPIIQKSGKKVYAWAVEFNLDEDAVSSNTFVMEWPPRSGKRKEFPEIDRGQWFGMIEARQKINPAQVRFLDELIKILAKPNN